MVSVKNDMAQSNLAVGNGVVQILDKYYSHLVVHLVVRTQANEVLHYLDKNRDDCNEL
jgi:hypothetical protein